MREFVANFQKKHGQQVPMPKIYGDEDSSDSDRLELADGTKVGKKSTGSARDGSGPSTSGRGVGRSGSRKRGWDDDGDDDDPNKHAGRQGMRVNHQDRWWPRKNHASRAQLTPESTESYQSSTSLARKKEPCWAITCWTGLWRRRRRSTRRGCREDW